MSIISAYVRENWYYSIEEIKVMFSFNDNAYSIIDEANMELKKFIKELLAQNIIKAKKKDDIEFENYNDNDLVKSHKCYSFSFIGIVICQNRIIYSYPKYIGENNKLPKEMPKKELAQVIRVIEKYSREKTKQDIRDIDLFVDEDDSGKINTLSVMLFLLEDFSINGAYKNDETIIEINGSNEILWQKTIDETYPIINDNRPYYIEMFTKRNITDDMDYYKRLHEYVVTCCSREIEMIGLTEFFSLPSTEISEDDETVFGDTDYILNQLDIALSITYDDRKIAVLKAMKLYFKSSKILIGDTEIQLIGTRAFERIWEEVCAKVFASQKGDKHTHHPNVNEIKPQIDYSIINKNFYSPPTLVELIKQPIWKKYSKNSKGIPKDTFNPDYLRFEKEENNDRYIFYILDAKYYCPAWNNDTIKGQPGIEDIAKQYLYYLAYREILEKYNVTEVKNYFLMPKRNGDSQFPGYVKLDILKQLGLGVIEVRMLPPEILYDNYLNNKNLSLSELD